MYDPFNFAPKMFAYFGDQSRILKAQLKGGKLVFEMPRPLYDRLRRAPGKGLIIGFKKLSDSEARPLASILEKQSQDSETPWFVTIAGHIPGIDEFVSWTADSIDAVRRLSGRPGLSPDQLSVLVAAGGTLYRVLSLSKDSQGREVLVNKIVYCVKVGDEIRQYEIFIEQNDFQLAGALTLSPLR